MNSKDESDVEVDYVATSLAGMLLVFLRRHNYEISVLVAVGAMISAFALFLFSPFEEYSAYGEIVRIDSGGMLVDVQGFGVNVLVGTLVENPVRVSQGICFSDPAFGNSRCNIGAKVELQMMGNNLGSEWWFVSAIVRGFGGNYTYADEKTEE